MTPLQTQFALVQSRYPNALMDMLPSGAAIITLPNEILPVGWSKQTSAVKFIAPSGYPFGNPDCFWADVDLRLTNGAMPQASNISAPPETAEPLLWFSWHVQGWNANRDNLLSYIGVIMNRFIEAK
jgi:hypothetical protein